MFATIGNLVFEEMVYTMFLWFMLGSIVAIGIVLTAWLYRRQNRRN